MYCSQIQPEGYFMYFVFREVVKSWHNQIIRAIAQAEFPDTQPHWWAVKPINPKLSTNVFAINSKAPIVDVYFTGSIFHPYSKKVLNLLRSVGIQFETFPAIMIDRKTQQPLPLEYEVFHLLEMYPAFDMTLTEEGTGYIRNLTLTEECLNSKKLMFRVEEAADLVLMHQDLKDLLDANNITGCLYTPVDQFSV